MDNNKEIEFIAKRYSRGSFNSKKAWKRLGIAHLSWWSRYGMVAAICGAVFLSATAALVYRHYKTDVVPEPAVITANKPVAPTEVVRVIDFENTTLPVVISKIKEVYGVEVINLPENSEDYHLSLHYEGNAVDLVNTINEILDTEMRVKE